MSKNERDHSNHELLPPISQMSSVSQAGETMCDNLDTHKSFLTVNEISYQSEANQASQFDDNNDKPFGHCTAPYHRYQPYFIFRQINLLFLNPDFFINYF